MEAVVTEVDPAELGDGLARFRVSVPSASRGVQSSLARDGQLLPLLVYRGSAGLEVIDGFKRLASAIELGWQRLRVSVLAVDAVGAKLRMFESNRATGLTELEEAWLVRSLYRDEELTQPAIGMRLGRHKSWVCRRLLLAESLEETLQVDVRLGLVSATAARELARLPRGNQTAAASVVSRRGLTTRQVAKLVDETLAAPSEARAKLLADAATAVAIPPRAPRTPSRATPAEALAHAIARQTAHATRLSVQLLGQPLAGLGPEGTTLAREQLVALGRVLTALSTTITDVVRRSNAMSIESKGETSVHVQ